MSARSEEGKKDDFQNPASVKLVRQVAQTPFLRGSGRNGRAVLLLDILPLLNRVCASGKLAL
jgi:hypothetical protein